MIPLKTSSSIETIKYDVFRNIKITRLTVSPNLKSIGDSTFKDCQILSGELNLLNVETISNYCFEGASLNRQLTLSNAESIGQDALKNTRISGKPPISSSLFNVSILCYVN